MPDTTAYILVALAVALNVPCGMYRATVPRLSARWFLAIHLPIPAILVLRVAAGYGYDAVPYLLAGALAGQLLGSWLLSRTRAPRATRARMPVPVSIEGDEALPGKHF